MFSYYTLLILFILYIENKLKHMGEQMEIDIIINQMLVLFIVMMIGYISNKKGILDENVNKKISSLLLNITAPALILSSVLNQEQKGNPSLILNVFILGIILYMILPFIGKLLAKLLKVPKEDENLYEFMTIFSNIGFMGFPVVESIFGSEAIFFVAIINLLFNIFCFSYGIYLISENDKVTFDFKILINPGIIVSAISIIIYITNLKLPTIMKESVLMIGQITTPLAMMLIGSSLAQIPVKEVLSEKKLYPYTFLKQLIIPIIFFLILKPFITNKLILGIIIVVSAMPVGATAIMFCNEYNGNTKLASQTIFITTLCSVVTVPILAYILLI